MWPVIKAKYSAGKRALNSENRRIHQITPYLWSAAVRGSNLACPEDLSLIILLKIISIYSVRKDHDSYNFEVVVQWVYRTNYCASYSRHATVLSVTWPYYGKLRWVGKWISNWIVGNGETLTSKVIIARLLPVTAVTSLWCCIGHCRSRAALRISSQISHSHHCFLSVSHESHQLYGASCAAPWPRIYHT